MYKMYKGTALNVVCFMLGFFVVWAIMLAL